MDAHGRAHPRTTPAGKGNALTSPARAQNPQTHGPARQPAAIPLLAHLAFRQAAGGHAPAGLPADTGGGGPGRAPPIQAKLTVGAAHDPLEQEADRVADSVSRSPDPPAGAAPAAFAQAAPGPASSPLAQRAAAPGAGPSGSPPPTSVESSIASGAGAGSPLPEGVRGKMEAAMGADFSSVRVHTGPRAAEMSRELHALAFTHERHIYFNEGKYDPHSRSGQHLLAHELAHVVQQAGHTGRIQRKPGDECGADFQFAFLGKINAEEAADHRGVPRVYYSRVPGAGKDAGDVAKGADQKPLRLVPGTEVQAGQLHGNPYWRAVCVPLPGVDKAQIFWVLNEYVDDPAKKPKTDAPKSGAKEEPKQAQKPVEGLLSKGVTITLDMNGGLTSRELTVTLKSDDAKAVSLTFSHAQGTKTQTVKIAPKKIRVKDALYNSATSTDGIHPVEIYLLGWSAEDPKKTAVETIHVGPLAPGKYAVIAADTFAGGAFTSVDLGVPATFSEVGEKIIEPRGDPQKRGGTWQMLFQVGPKLGTHAALYILKDPDKDDGVLCYFAASAPKPGARAIQTAPSRSMKVPLPVSFEELDIEQHATSNASVTYRFLPPQYSRGILVTYEMNPSAPKGQDPANAMHGLNVYPFNTGTGKTDSPLPAARARFRQVKGEWQIGGEKRTVESFRSESGIDALAKLPGVELPKNELTALLGQMSLIAMTAVKEGVSSQDLFDRWVELSFGATIHGPDALKGDVTAKGWLDEKLNGFLTALLAEIGSAGTDKTINASGVGYAGGQMTTTYTNKYTGASSEEVARISHVGQRTVTTNDLKKPFEDVRALFAAGKYEDGVAKLRSSYYRWIEDRLVSNTSKDKDALDRLRSYGQQLAYRRQLRETILAEKTPLKKVRALYYPDQGNITGANKWDVKRAGEKTVSLPLDIFYQDTGQDWVLYNFTTLTQPGKLNTFKRTRTKGPGEFAPPQGMFELLTKDEGIGKGYIHYQTETGEGGIVRVEHPWTLGGVLLGAAAVVGLIALALTGIGLVFEGAAVAGVTAAGAGAVLGDIAMITAVAGGAIKLATDVSEGAPVTPGQVAGLGLDIATAALPVLRSARGLSAFKGYKSGFVLLDTAINAKWAAKLELAANTTAIVVSTGKGIEELMLLSQAVDEGRVDKATFYWAVLRNVGLGVINVVLLRSGFKALEGRTVGKTTVDEAVQKGLAKSYLEAKPDAMYSRANFEKGIDIMRESSSVYRSMVLEALASESKLKQAIDVLCYLGKKGRGSLSDVVLVDGKVRRAIDLLVEGKFFGRTLGIPQGFTGSKGEALDAEARDFPAFSKAVSQGVNDVPGLAGAEVRLQGSATMGIARPKKPTPEGEAARPAEPQASKEAPKEAAAASGGKTWDLDLAIMMEPEAYTRKLVDIFRNKVGYTDKKKGKIDLDSMSPAEVQDFAKRAYAEYLARKQIKEAADAKGEKPAYPEKVYNSECYTFANGIVTGKANMSSGYFPEIAALQRKLMAQFKIPGLDLSVIAKKSGFDSTPFIVLK